MLETAVADEDTIGESGVDDEITEELPVNPRLVQNNRFFVLETTYLVVADVNTLGLALVLDKISIELADL